MKHSPKAARGLTLIELMVAVAIAGILASISIYSFSNNRQRSECYGTIRELRILLAEARQKAQSSGLPVFLRFVPLSGRGTSLDGEGKIFVRWERLGCAGGNDSWNCVHGTPCAIDDKGNFTTSDSCNESESVGSWIEVADTLRIVYFDSGGNRKLAKGYSAENDLNFLCWSGTDSTRKVAVASMNGFCAFDNVGNEIPDITLACVDKANTETMIELQGDGVVSIDAMTGLSRIDVP